MVIVCAPNLRTNSIMATSFKETLKAFKHPKMLYLFILGMSSGLPFALTLGTLQAWMTEPTVNVSLKTIGLFAFLRLPFSLKFMWSPLMDRYTFPFLDRRRGWVVISQFLLIVALIGMSMVQPQEQTLLLMILVLFCNIFGASQDIVLDAYKREVLSNEELGLGSGIFVNGYLLSFRFISGAGAILLSKYISWNSVYQVMAVLMFLFLIATLKAPKCEQASEPPKNLKEAFLHPLQEYFSREGALTILAFIILYKIGDNMLSTMTIPFILKSGFTKEEFVAISKVWGLISVLIGGLIGGLFVHRFGIIRSLWIMGFLQAISNATFAILAEAGKSIPTLIGVIGFENLTGGMGTAAYAAFMASVTNTKFTATQYALLSSLMAIPGIIFASRTGGLSESLGWTNFFLFCTVVAIPGMFLIPFLYKEPEKFQYKIIKNAIIGLTLLGGIYATTMSIVDLVKLFFPESA